jgi:3-phosphoinositide dependent protein kinase-1
MLDKNYNLKLIDFGSARKIDEEEEEEEQKLPEDPVIDHRPSFVGSLNYMSPEMVKGQPPSYGSDLWAFGCIIFKMITGKAAFPGTKHHAVTAQIENNTLEWPAGTSTKIDPSLINFVLQLLQK